MTEPAPRTAATARHDEGPNHAGWEQFRAVMESLAETMDDGPMVTNAQGVEFLDALAGRGYRIALAAAEAPLAGRVAALEALLTRAIESLHDAERELHVWVDRDRERHPGWPDVGYEPWSNKPSLALWSVDVSEIERDARALAAPAPTPSEPVAAAGLCIWEGKFLDHPGRYICDLPPDAFAHAHSATCPPEHGPSWECHTFQAAEAR